MTDEPILIAHLIARGAGSRAPACSWSGRSSGSSYLRGFRDACRDAGIALVAEETIAQIDQDIESAVRPIHESKPDALVHLGFGFGVIRINEALRSLRLGPAPVHGDRRSRTRTSATRSGTRSWAGSASSSTTRATPSASASSTGSRRSTGAGRSTSRRCCRRDVAMSFLRAFADAQPLSPRGVMEALERVKMVPRGVRLAGDAASRSASGPAGVDGRRLPHRALAEPRPGDALPRRPVRGDLTLFVRGPLLALEVGLALLGERLRAFLGVVRRRTRPGRSRARARAPRARSCRRSRAASCRMASTASGPLAAIVSAISMRLVERLAVGHDVADQPDLAASVGGDVLPVSRISAATRVGDLAAQANGRAGHRVQRPARLAHAEACADSPATRMSVPCRISVPPAIATPSTAAMIGFVGR